MIFTFYSFKGGVGRSMMLANVAEFLYQRGLNVLMVDFDLEAPGLDRFFANEKTTPRLAELVGSRGVLDLLISYKALRALPLANSPAPRLTLKSKNRLGAESEHEEGLSDAASDSSAVTAPQVFPYQVEPLENFIQPIRMPADGSGGSLWLMPAGRRLDNEYSLYADRVRAFDWDEFYSQWNGEQFFEWLGDELTKAYDVVLIDSRTGITEMSGVYTHQLADAVVLFVAANEQNLDGTRRMAASLSRKELVAPRRGRELSILIIPSRVELAEGSKLTEFAAKFTKQLAGMIDRRINFRDSAFLDLRVPYIPFYAFGEGVAVRDPDLPIAADLIAATTRICSAMFELVPKDSDTYNRYQAALTNLPKPSPTVSFKEPPPDFTGRDWVLVELDKWLRESSAPTMLILGGPGSGKSALAARMVAAAGRGGEGLGPLRLAGRVLVAHACRPEAGWRSFVEALVRALAARSPQFAVAVSRSASMVSAISVRVKQRIGSAPGPGSALDLSLDSISIGTVSVEQAFRVLVQQPLQDTANASPLSNETTGPVLVLVDELDAEPSSEDDNLVDLLVAATKSGWPPPALKLLILSRPDPRVLRIEPHAVIDLDANSVQTLQDISAYAELRLRTRLPVAQRRVVVKQVTDAANGNFLYARLVIDALLVNAPDERGVLNNVDRLFRPGKVPEELNTYYIALVQQTVGFNMERWAQRCRPFVGLLAVAPEGLTQAQLAGILRRSDSEVADNLRLLSGLLLGPSASGHYRLFHSSFASFILNNPDYGMSAAEANEAIADYLLAQYGKRWTEDVDPSAVRYVDYHVREAVRTTEDRRKRSELLDRLADLVLEPSFVQAKLAAHMQSDLLAGIDTVLALAPEYARSIELRLLSY
jgi:MinD-like ATPase involved in chromosome partitioning or flagellar assembly